MTKLDKWFTLISKVHIILTIQQPCSYFMGDTVHVYMLGSIENIECVLAFCIYFKSVYDLLVVTFIQKNCLWHFGLFIPYTMPMICRQGDLMPFPGLIVIHTCVSGQGSTEHSRFQMTNSSFKVCSQNVAPSQGGRSLNLIFHLSMWVAWFCQSHLITNHVTWIRKVHHR